MALDITTLSASEQAQILYVGYFKRPAEPEGLAFWTSFLQNQENGPTQLERLTNATDRFANADEASADFPFLNATNPSQADIDAFVTSVYQNLFNRNPEQAGLEFYRGRVQDELAKDVPKFSNIVLDIFVGANNDDLTTLQNKIAAADAYTSALVDQGLVYDEAEGENLVGSVTDQTANPAQEGSVAASDNPSQSGGAGSTFTLTANQDDVPGTAGDDTINAPIVQLNDASFGASLQDFDDIDGANGVDTLNATFNATGPVAPVVMNVEEIFVRATSAALDFDTANVSGATQVWSRNSSQDLTISNAGSLDTIFGARSQTNAVTVEFTDSVVTGASDTVQLAVDGAGSTTTPYAVAVRNETGTGSVVEGVSVLALGKNYVDATGLGGGITTVTVTGAGSVDFGATIDTTAVNEVDASGNSGGVTADLSGSGSNLNLTGGSGADNFRVGAGNDTVNTASGNDRVAFTSGQLTANDSADGGVGNDTISINAGDLGALSNATNFEVLGLSGGSGTVDNASLGFQTVTLEAGLGGAATLTGFATVNVQANQTNLVTIGNVGGSDSVTLVVDDTNDAASTFVGFNGGLNLTGVEQVSIDTISGDSFSTPAGVDFQVSGVNSLTANGSGDVNLSQIADSTPATNDVATVNLTGLTGAAFVGDIPGATTYQVGNLDNQSSFGATFSIDFGGDGVADDFDGDGAGGDAISLLGLTAGAADTVTFAANALGEANDILVLNGFEGGGDITDDQLDFSAFSGISSTSNLTFINFDADAGAGTQNAVAVTSPEFAGTLTLIGVQAADLNDGDFTFS